MRDPYDVLGVGRNAGEAEIKKAYRKLAKTYHPDRNADDPKAKDRFAEVNSAYEIVGDAQKKAQFDRGEIDGDGKPKHQGFDGFAGQRGARSRAGGFGFEGFTAGTRSAGVGDEIFSHIFGEAFRSAGAGRAEEPRGEDIAAELTVTLEQIVGEEKLRIALPTGRDVDIVVPKGVVDGQTVRLRGLGRPGAGRSQAGDVLLTLRVAPHERFKVEGSDLRETVDIDLEEAVLGGTIRVPTLEGAVDMKISERTSSGRTFRLRGKGLPTREGGRGDLFATVQIRLPADDEALMDYARQRRAARAV